MQSNGAVCVPATPVNDIPTPFTVTPGFLLAAFATVPDPRRTDDTRHLIASSDLVGYLDWPGHAQVFRLERTWTEKGKAHHVVRYGITSLPPSVADAARLLAIKRAHWQIENRLYRPKDTALDEDASLLHKGRGPDIMAILRNLALSLLHAQGIDTIAAQLRHFSSHPEEAVAFVATFSPQNA